jgi:ATP-dependent Clp protease ATP-binding subunit ClpC
MKFTLVGAGGATGSLMLRICLNQHSSWRDSMYWCNNIDEYRQYIEKDGALERRFQKIIVEPTSVSKQLPF